MLEGQLTLVMGEQAHRRPWRPAPLGWAAGVEDVKAVLLFVERKVAVAEDDGARPRETALQAGQAAVGGSGVVDDGHGLSSELKLQRRRQGTLQRRLVDVAVHRVDRGAEAFEFHEHGGREEVAGVDHRLRFANELYAAIGQPAASLRHVRVGEDGDHATEMDLWAVIARIYCMLTLSPRGLPLTLLVAPLAFLASLTAPSAMADVGVERVSRLAGAPGDAVELTVGCGFCYPPCEGPEGDRSGVCMPGTERPPPSFPVSLVPIEKVPKPYRCGPRRFCTPQAPRPPQRAPFTLLGWAKPPAQAQASGRRHLGGGGFGHGSVEPPRYVLDFQIPDLRPGVYSYVIYCASCQRGQGGSLIAFPERRWRLRVRPLG